MASIQSTNMSNIQYAVEDLVNGKFRSIRQCARHWHVNRSTLGRRFKGKQERREYHIKSQLLTPLQEAAIVAMIKDLQRSNRPISTLLVRQAAQQIGDRKEPPGKTWYAGFLARWPRLRTGPGRQLEYARTVALNDNIVGDFFDEFEYQQRQYSFPSNRIWNMDEIGFRQGQRQGEKCVYDRSEPAPIISSSNDYQWSTVIECAAADGRSIDPFVIHTGTDIYNSYFPTDPTDRDRFNDWRWSFSDKGWSNNKLAIHWLINHFVRLVNPTQDAPVLLILDGHISHTTGEFLIAAWINHVKLLFIPSHSSHKLQPLDQGVFAHIKRIYNDELKQESPYGDTKINRRQFNLIYERTRRRGFTIQYVQSGWSRTGISPLNRARILQDPDVVNISQTSGRLVLPTGHSQREATPIDEDLLRQLHRDTSVINVSPNSKRGQRHLIKDWRRATAEAAALQIELAAIRTATKTSQTIASRIKIGNNKERQAIAMVDVVEALGDPTNEELIRRANMLGGKPKK